MRKVGPPSEIAQLAAPLARGLDAIWRRMHWWIATMAVLYFLSGITIVRPDEVAMILRWGRLVGATPALQEHGPGLLFALPRPIDQVVRVQVKHVWEVPVKTLTGSDAASIDELISDTLNPITQGYALTGDQNIVQVDVIARYRVRDPAEWAFYGPKSADILRVEVSAAMVRSLGEMGIDRVLSDGRKELIAEATRRAQEGLDASHSGLELSSLELIHLAPPSALASDFDAVQSAFIGAQTEENNAQAYAQSVIPQAQADAIASEQTARGDAESALAKARGDAGAFRALDREYRLNPGLVRERSYTQAISQAIAAAGRVIWVPPPSHDRYHGFRISVPNTEVGAKPIASATAQKHGGTISIPVNQFNPYSAE
jgi:modulator of FtsH protease HflK